MYYIIYNKNKKEPLIIGLFADIATYIENKIYIV